LVKSAKKPVLYRPLLYLAALRIKYHSWLLPGILAIIFTGGLYYLSWFITDLVYEPEMRQLIHKFLLAAVLFILLFLFFFALFIITSVIIQRFIRWHGAIMRFKLIYTYLIFALLPSVIFIIIAVTILNSAIDQFSRVEIVESLQESLELLRENIAHYKVKTLEPLRDMLEDKLLSAESGVLYYDPDTLKRYAVFSGLDYLSILDAEFHPVYISGQNNNRRFLELLGQYPLTKIIKNPRDSFSTYHAASDLVAAVIPVTDHNKKITGYAAAGRSMIPFFSAKSQRIIQAVKQMRQLEALKEPIKNGIVFIFIFTILPILSLGILFFYRHANQITMPVADMLLATRQIASGNFDTPIAHKGKDEIRYLTNAFELMAQDLKISRLKLNRTAHIEAWHDVALRLAHEIKNPLTPIQLACDRIEKETARRDIELYSSLQSSLQLIKSGMHTLKNLVNDFSQFSRELVIQNKPVHIEKLIMDISPMLSHYPISCRFQLSRKNHALQIDAGKLRQVLINLVQNAVDSILESKKTGGQIIISSRVVKKLLGSFYTIVIEDNGPGIKEEHRQHIFEPHFTTKKNGSGLGLSICERFIRAQGGNIYFENGSAGGTKFFIELPV